MSKAYPERNYSTYSLGGIATPTTPRFKSEGSEKGNVNFNGGDGVLDTFRRLKRCATDKWLSRNILFPIMSVTFILTLVMQIMSPALSINPMNKVCSIGFASIPLLVFLGFFIVIICPVLFCLIYGIRDAYGVRNELIVTLVSGTIAYIGFFLFERIFENLGQYFGSYLFAWVSLIVCHTLSITVPLLRTFELSSKSIIPSFHISRTSSFKSYSSEIMTNSKKYAQFMDVLEDSQEFEKYRECAAACFCTELILFLEEYQFLKLRVAQCCNPDMIASQQDDESIQEPEKIHVQNLNTFMFPETKNLARSSMLLPSTPCTISIVETISAARWIPFPIHELRNDYLMFYETFFDQTSDLAINLRGSTLTSVKAMIQNDHFEISMFEKAREEVLVLLYRNTFDRFLRIYSGGTSTISVSYKQNK
ncbi:1015_t:CDS:2 [Ambispora gerdemannii]|uniref:1015_t:CDS:1 n=1 Tax=Ambispora gerdemannii TaxID=144530 RepID=A0A9N9APW5_9GLOM|nr:1015_t:CDS:2 [Ambispora gerdemannii]